MEIRALWKKAKDNPEVERENLCQRKPKGKRSKRIFSTINKKSKKYLRGCVSGIFKAASKGPRKVFTYLFTRRPLASTPIATSSTEESLQKQTSDEDFFEAVVLSKIPDTGPKAPPSQETVLTQGSYLAISAFKIYDQTDVIPESFPDIYHCRRIRQFTDVFFIPTAEDSVYRKYISSIKIRDLMEKKWSHPKKITSELASLILGPHRKHGGLSNLVPLSTVAAKVTVRWLWRLLIRDRYRCISGDLIPEARQNIINIDLILKIMIRN